MISMIKNIFLKNFLINTVFKFLSILNQYIPKNDKNILLYSNEGFRDNIKYLYDYLISNNYNDYYKIICATNRNFPDVHNDKNIKTVSLFNGILYYMFSGHVYYCFGRIPIIPRKDQIVIQMWHGTSFKGFDKSTQQTNSIKNQFYTYVFASSDFFVPIIEKKFSVYRKNVYICGHPRNDWLFKNDVTYNLGEFKKRIIWLPTFRKSSKLGYTDVTTDNIVPFFKIQELNNLDQFLKRLNCQIIIKFHPMQDLPYLDHVFSNILILSDREFSEKGYDLYTLLGQMDALITDYSSVFYDFLLLDRPIGFTEDDESEYSKNRGFAIRNPDEFKPGFRIKKKNDFYYFIESIKNDIDNFKKKREDINKLTNAYLKGNCKRALECSNIMLNSGRKNNEE